MPTASHSNTEPLTVKMSEAKRLLGVKDLRTLRRLINAGKITATRRGRYYMVDYQSLKAYAAKGDAK